MCLTTRVSFFLLAAAALAGCSSVPAGSPPVRCQNGTVERCACDDGGRGIRVCGDFGGYGACDCSPAAGLELTGLDEDPVDGLRLAFGPVLVGTVAEDGFGVRNRGVVPMPFEITAPGAPFSLVGPASGTVEPGATVPVAVAFAPLNEGTGRGALTVRSGTRFVEVDLVGDGYRPDLDCGGFLLDLGVVGVGSTANDEVRCVSQAPGPFPIEIRALGDTGDFDVPLGPQGELGPGQTWTVPVSFTATRVGPSHADLALVGADDPIGLLRLRATVVERALAADPAEVDFGFVAPGTDVERTITLLNHTSTPIPLDEILLDDTSSAAFSFASRDLPQVVPAARDGDPGFTVLYVGFRPEGDGPHGGTILLGSDDGAFLAIPLRGFGGGPRIACAPDVVEFGTVSSSLPATRSVVCTNVGTGTAGLVIDELRSTSSEFAAVPRETPPPAGYGVGESFTLDLTYAPENDGIDAAGIEVVAGAVNSPYRIAVGGTGRDLEPCDLEVSPSPLRFGAVAPGLQAVGEVVLRNRRADEACLIRDLRLAASCGAAFSLPEGERAVALIEGGGELPVPVRFAPVAAGEAACDLLFEAADPASPHRVVPIEGTAKQPCLLFDPPAVELDSGAPGCAPRTRTVTAFNACGSTLHLAGIESTRGPGDPEFVVRAQPPAGTSIYPGHTFTFDVAYRPGDLGPDVAGFLVSVDDGPVPYLVPARGVVDSGPRTDSFKVGAWEVDLLLVIDNGATMAPVQLELASGLTSFLAWADGQGLSWRIGTTTTGLAPSTTPGCPGGAAGGEDGRLFPVDDTRPRWLTPNTPNRQGTWSANVTVGTCQGPGAPMEAASRAVRPPVSDSLDDPRHPEPNDGNDGFLRPDAHLAVLAVTDRADPSPQTVNYYEQVLRMAKGFGDHDRFSFHAITGDPGTGCTRTGGGAAAPGDRLADLVGRTQGTFASVCTADWEGSLRALGEGIFSRATRPCFPLAGPPEDANANGQIDDSEVQVRVDGTPVPMRNASGVAMWSVAPARDEVCFAPLARPEPGATVELTYRIACLLN